MPGETNFIGRGITFPVEIDHTGSIALTSGSDDIARSMRMVLATARGERVMRPEFGCAIWDLLFEPINANTLGLMAQAVREALAQWEPRATVEQVTVTPDGADTGRVTIGITYRVKVTNDRRNLVYPFYVIPQEGET
jgi:phage baseplate assembly protein W